MCEDLPTYSENVLSEPLVGLSLSLYIHYPTHTHTPALTVDSYLSECLTTPHPYTAVCVRCACVCVDYECMHIQG